MEWIEVYPRLNNRNWRENRDHQEFSFLVPLASSKAFAAHTPDSLTLPFSKLDSSLEADRKTDRTCPESIVLDSI